MRFPILIGVRRSRFLDVFVVFSALLAGLALWFFPLNVGNRVLLLGLLGSLTALTWRQLTPKIAALRLEQNGGISLQRIGEMDFSPAEILPGASVHPLLSVLRFKQDNHRALVLVLAVDGLNPQDFRRLRVFLRWRVRPKRVDDDV